MSKNKSKPTPEYLLTLTERCQQYIHGLEAEIERLRPPPWKTSETKELTMASDSGSPCPRCGASMLRREYIRPLDEPLVIGGGPMPPNATRWMCYSSQIDSTGVEQTWPCRARAAETKIASLQRFERQDHDIRTAHGWKRDARELPEIVQSEIEHLQCKLVTQADELKNKYRRLTDCPPNIDLEDWLSVVLDSNPRLGSGELLVEGMTYYRYDGSHVTEDVFTWNDYLCGEYENWYSTRAAVEASMKAGTDDLH